MPLKICQPLNSTLLKNIMKDQQSALPARNCMRSLGFLIIGSDKFSFIFLFQILVSRETTPQRPPSNLECLHKGHVGKT